ALSLLREKDLVRARELALRIEDVCQARRKQQDAILEQAEQEIVQGRYLDDPALVLGSSKWNHGIVGIVAGRLADKYDRPVVVVGFEAGLGSGSVRGPAGMPLYDAVASCRAHLVRFGGHQAACGLTVQEAKLAALRGEFVDFFRHYQPTSVAPQRAALDLVPGDDLRQVLSDLYLLEPCGEGNPAPLLRIPARVLPKRALRGGHLKLELEAPGSGRVGAFAPGLGELLDDLGSETVVRGSLRPDRFRGGEALELLVVAVEPGAG